jgi:drug/metabolite transporter (DMT)-like permease
MLASAACFTASVTLIKYLGADYPAALQAFYRQAASVVVLLPLIARNPMVFRTTRPGILLFRASAGTIGLILAFYAYQKLPLADANALSFTRTLWIVPLAAFVLHERVGPRRIGATIAGFLGAVLMVQPAATGAMGWAALAALASAFLFALTVTGMKIMTRDHTTATLVVYAAVLGLLFSIPPALFVWRVPDLVDLLLLAAMGMLGLVTQACYIKGMSIGDAAAMAPIDYTRLIFALLVGFVLFQEIPNAITMLGAAIVIASTLYITWREMQLGLKPSPAQPE